MPEKFFQKLSQILLTYCYQYAIMSTTTGTHPRTKERKKMKRTRCIKAEQIEEKHGFTINREEDRQYNDFTGEYYGRTYVFYTVNDPEEDRKSVV